MAIFFDRVASGDSKSDELQGSLPDSVAALHDVVEASGPEFSDALKKRIARELRRYPLYFEWHEANSIEANARLKNFAEGLGKALKALEYYLPFPRNPLL